MYLLFIIRGRTWKNRRRRCLCISDVIKHNWTHCVSVTNMNLHKSSEETRYDPFITHISNYVRWWYHFVSYSHSFLFEIIFFFRNCYYLCIPPIFSTSSHNHDDYHNSSYQMKKYSCFENFFLKNPAFDEKKSQYFFLSLTSFLSLTKNKHDIIDWMAQNSLLSEHPHAPIHTYIPQAYQTLTRKNILRWQS